MQQGTLVGLIRKSLSLPQRTWGPQMSSRWGLHLKRNCITRPICLCRKMCSSWMNTLLLCVSEWTYIWEKWKNPSRPIEALFYWKQQHFPPRFLTVLSMPLACYLEIGYLCTSVCEYTYRHQIRFRGRVWNWHEKSSFLFTGINTVFLLHICESLRAEMTELGYV